MSDALLALIERGETRRYRKGTLLIQEGDFGDTIFISRLTISREQPSRLAISWWVRRSPTGGVPSAVGAASAPSKALSRP